MPILGVNRCHSPEPVCKYSPDLGSSYKLQRMLSALRDRCGLQGHFTNSLPITINVSSSTHDHHVPLSSGVTGEAGACYDQLDAPNVVRTEARSIRNPSRSSGFCCTVYSQPEAMFWWISALLCLTWRFEASQGAVLCSIVTAGPVQNDW